MDRYIPWEGAAGDVVGAETALTLLNLGEFFGLSIVDWDWAGNWGGSDETDEGEDDESELHFGCGFYYIAAGQ